MNTTRDRCYKHLEIPVDFKPWDFGYTNQNKFCELDIRTDMINTEIHDFFDSIGLVLLRGRYFHCLPGMRYNLHTDNKFEPDRELIKINWVFGGRDSDMIWYNLKPGKSPMTFKNHLGEDIVGYNNNDCVEIARTNIAKLAIVNVAVIHTIQNADEFRDCYSMVLAWKHTGARLDWNESVERMSPYIKN